MITSVNLATPGHPYAGPLLIVAPVLAAVTLGPWLTTLTGVLAWADQMIFAVLLGDLHSAQRITQIFAVVAAAAFAALLSGTRERKARELTRVRQVSEIAQNLVLRPLPPRMGPLRVAAVYLASEREMKIGGDLYAAARTAHGTRLLIGDVRGKGLTAVSDAALLLSAFRGAAHRQTSLAEFTTYLDASVCWNLAEPGEKDLAQECFVTAMLIDIPDHSPTVQIVHCGHPPPLRLRPGQATALCAHQAGPPLGLQLDIPGHCVDTFDFGQGDLLLLYTDGVTEARNPRGDFYPLTERAATWSGKRPEELLEHLRTDLLAHAGGQLDDDAAMIAIERPVGRIRHNATALPHKHRSETASQRQRLDVLRGSRPLAAAVLGPQGHHLVRRSWSALGLRTVQSVDRDPRRPGQ
ncbi:PP2C family protein-serine/threonine phosphatase [Streptomyces nodosus]|uniref:PP2C family protein-serine/threonine phosphatase n=1 Tax=Streptomyces nodosus TaxID=40318 RepID=UPI0007C874FA|nr:PP2C family protein-serine/threonine phosphatase [Streptomyces nodosus]MBB4790301.1 serine phosphatase RsbU (regulator of sigma subunit) [Streptomyces nodosus]